MLLELFRNHKRWLMFIAMVLVIPSFVVSGIYSYNRMLSDDGAIAKVDDVSILPQQFDEAKRQRLENLRVRLGEEFRTNMLDSQEAKVALLNCGSSNCIWNGFTMEGREDDYTFSEPYMLNEQVLVVKKDAGIKSWDDLAGKTVITQTDSAAQDVLEGDQKDLAATFATLDTIGEYNTAFMQLESGAVDAVACDLSIAQYQLAAKSDAYTQLDKPLSSEHYAVGFKKGDTRSADAVTESLKALYEDGTVKDLCDKYADYGLSFDNWVLK